MTGTLTLKSGVVVTFDDNGWSGTGPGVDTVVEYLKMMIEFPSPAAGDPVACMLREASQLIGGDVVLTEDEDDVEDSEEVVY